MFKSMILLALTALDLPNYEPSHEKSSDESKIERAILDYIESQHRVKPELMERGLDKSLIKRTYWLDANGDEFILEANYEAMVKLAETYNKDGEKFPKKPKVVIQILDIDQRTASAKLIVDEWIDYMHLYKDKSGDWKIINVLWQFHDLSWHADEG